MIRLFDQRLVGVLNPSKYLQKNSQSAKLSQHSLVTEANGSWKTDIHDDLYLQYLFKSDLTEAEIVRIPNARVASAIAQT